MIPTPLPDLKKEKTYFKMLVKRDKDIEVLRKKNDKVIKTESKPYVSRLIFKLIYVMLRLSISV